MEEDLPSIDESIDVRRVLATVWKSQQEQAAIWNSVVSKIQEMETRSRFLERAVVGKKDPDTLRGIGLPTAEAADPGHGTLVNSDVETTNAFVAPSHKTLRRSARLRNKTSNVSLPLTGETGSIFVDAPEVRTLEQKFEKNEISPQLPDQSPDRREVATPGARSGVKFGETSGVKFAETSKVKSGDESNVESEI